MVVVSVAMGNSGRRLRVERKRRGGNKEPVSRCTVSLRYDAVIQNNDTFNDVERKYNYITGP
jgi:hypothetical protein